MFWDSCHFLWPSWRGFGEKVVPRQKISSKTGTGMISWSNSPEENINRSIGPAGTCRKTFDWWAPNLKSTSSAIATLTDTALLLTEDESEFAEYTAVFVLPPVVQSFMAATNRIAEGSISKCGRHVRMSSTMSIVITTRHCSTRKRLQPRTPTFSLCSHRTYAIKQLHQTDSQRLLFTWYRGCTVYLRLRQSFGQSCYIAEALLALGGTYCRLSNFEPAERYLAETY